MTPQELENYQRGEYLHWGLFLKDVPRMEQMIREAVQRGVYLNPTMGYELGSQSSLARKHEDLMYDLFRDGALMAYYPENLADGSLLKFRAIRNFSVRHENLVPLTKLSPDEIRRVQRGVPSVGRVRETLGAGGRQDHGRHRRSVSRRDRLQSAHGNGDARGGRAHADAGAQGDDDLGSRSHDGQAEGPGTTCGRLHWRQARSPTSWCLAPTRSTTSTTRAKSNAS